MILPKQDENRNFKCGQFPIVYVAYIEVLEELERGYGSDEYPGGPWLPEWPYCRTPVLWRHQGHHHETAWTEKTAQPEDFSSPTRRTGALCPPLCHTILVKKRGREDPSKWEEIWNDHPKDTNNRNKYGHTKLGGLMLFVSFFLSLISKKGYFRVRWDQIQKINHAAF